MNKKLMMFMLVGIFGVLGVMLVVAGLVDYLSEEKTVDVNVQSPFEVRSLSEGQVLPNYSELDLNSALTKDGVVGGDTYEVTFGFQALSNNAMDVIEQYIIGGQGTTCDDFVEIGWSTCTNECQDWAEYNTLDLSDSMNCDDSSGKVIINAPNSYDAGEINVNKLNLTLQPNAFGDYSISAQVIPTA